MESVFAQHLSCGSNVAMRSTVTALSIVSTASGQISGGGEVITAR